MLKAKTKNISIVLYKPKYAGNIGSVARAAKNMGISNIIVAAAAGFDRPGRERIIRCDNGLRSNGGGRGGSGAGCGPVMQATGRQHSDNYQCERHERFHGDS